MSVKLYFEMESLLTMFALLTNICDGVSRIIIHVSERQVVSVNPVDPLINNI